MAALNRDLELPLVGDMEHFSEEAIEMRVEEALTDAATLREKLRGRRKYLESRAATNFSLLKEIAGLA
jgi:hypothetical protein